MRIRFADISQRVPVDPGHRLPPPASPSAILHLPSSSLPSDSRLSIIGVNIVLFFHFPIDMNRKKFMTTLASTRRLLWRRR